MEQQVFDPIRKRYVALTPEERVRQLLIQHLTRTLGYPEELIQVEGSITVNGLKRRCDIVVFDRTVKPLMIVECKKPDVPINQKVLDQICRYNTTLHVPFLLLTNGTQTLMLKVSATPPHLTKLTNIPDYNTLLQHTEQTK